MPIKWSALRVSEAADRIEAHISRAVEPLEQARLVAREALNIPNLPQYVHQHLRRIVGEIDRAIGGGFEPLGRLRAGIQSVRESIPRGEVDAERRSAAGGSMESLL